MESLHRASTSDSEEIRQVCPQVGNHVLVLRPELRVNHGIVGAMDLALRGARRSEILGDEWPHGFGPGDQSLAFKSLFLFFDRIDQLEALLGRSLAFRQSIQGRVELGE